jgi:hypothetical protein
MNPLYKTLYSYPTFRKWWANKLNSRPTKLYDFETGKMMSLEKRFIREMPKVTDLFDFANYLGAVTSVVFPNDHTYYVSIASKANVVSYTGEDLIQTFITAITNYLNNIKESNE